MRHKAHRITIFNHKGGVGKTTLTVNIGAALATAGKTVLLVDSDPQCNLTSYLIEDKVVDSFLDTSDSPTGKTVWTGLKPVVEGTSGVRFIKPFETPISNLFLLPGDIRLSEYEQSLGDFWRECLDRKIRGFRGMSSLSSLVNECSEKLNADFVFYDTGPNIGPLNRAILLDCDYFIVPAACDLFSVRALKTLGHTLSEWIRRWNGVLDLAPDGVELLPGKPKFLGYIPQRFRVYGQAMTRPYSHYLSQLERHIYSELMSVLRAIDPSLSPQQITGTKLGEVREFSGLVQMGQQQGKPIYQIQGGTAVAKTEAQKAFQEIANKITSKVS
jgi:cellulose biosynthesis protein BcsQ